MVVKVYYTNTCTYCHVLMDWLDSLGVKYQEINAETMEDVKTVPMTEIGSTRIIGLDRPAIKKALKEEGII